MRDKTRRAGTVSEQEGLGIVISVLLHLLLAASVLLWQQFSVSRFHNLTPNYQNVSLLGSAPQTQTPAPSSPPPPPPQPAPPQPAPPVAAAAPTPPPPPAPQAQAIRPRAVRPEIKPETDASRQLDERLQRMRAEQERQRRAEAERQRRVEAERQRQAEAERQRRAEAERQRREEQALQNAISQLQNRQEGVNAGAAQAGGAASSNIDPLLNAYHDQLWSRIQPNWTLSRARLQDYQTLTAIVTLRIRPDGTLERLWLEESSGNQVYDNAALHAAERSAPFGAPPIANQGVYYEISLRFLGKDR